MTMIGVGRTVSGQWMIVDVDDDNAPLITFHNELNDVSFVKFILDCIENESKRVITGDIKQSFLGDCK